MTEQLLTGIISDALAKIIEHADAVQILVSWNEDEMTKCIKTGAGNWYARQGMAHDFIKTDTAQTTAHELQGVIQPEEEE